MLDLYVLVCITVFCFQRRMFYFIRKIFSMYKKIYICIPNTWLRQKFAIQHASSNAIYKGNSMVKMVYWDRISLSKYIPVVLFIFLQSSWTLKIVSLLCCTSPSQGRMWKCRSRRRGQWVTVGGSTPLTGKNGSNQSLWG